MNVVEVTCSGHHQTMRKHAKQRNQKQIMLGPQEGSDKNGGEKSQQQQQKIRKFKSLPSYPHAPPTPHRVLSRRKIPQPQWLFLLNSPQ